jgi:outer membrane receptor protein involved in Fe transport
MEPGSTQKPHVAAASRWLACALLGMLFGAQAATVESVPVLSKSIPSQPLAAALAEFAHQTRLQFVYVTTIVRSRTSRDVPAGLEPVDALGRLLGGTGLSFEFLNPRTVRIFETATAAPTAPSKTGEAPQRRIESEAESVSRTKDSGALDEVIVTAQKQSEIISTVPMSISVISAGDLGREHITNIPDLTRAVSNVSFTTQGGPGLSTLEIRGISSQAGTAAIGVYLNDASLTTLSGLGTAEPRFFDLDRVEVLRGPQGTLYGGGTLGGVIRFIEKQPNLAQFDASAGTEVSATRHGSANYNVEGVLNLPVLDGRVALRLGAQQGHDSGYIDQVGPTDLSVIAKGINGNRWTVAKAALKWQMNDAWSATPAIFYQRFESDDIDAFFEVVPDGQPLAGQALRTFQTSKTVREPGTDSITIPNLTIEGDLGVADLTIVGSRYVRDFAVIQDGTIDSSLAGLFPAGSAVAIGLAALKTVFQQTTHQSQTSAEARLASKPYTSGTDLPISWLAGAFYLDDTTELTGTHRTVGIFKLFNEFGLDINDPNVFFRSFPGAWTAGDVGFYGHRIYRPSQRAVFGELTYHVRDDVRITVGLRYESANEAFERDANYYVTFCGRPPDLLGNPPMCPLQFAPPTASFSATTPRAVVSWDLDESKLVYVSAAKGYREGSFNRPIPIRGQQVEDLQNLGLCDGTPANCAAAIPTAFKPDSLWSYEVGSKFRAFENRLSVDAAVYYLKWNDTQQDIVLAVSGYDFESNVGHVESYGVELDVKARPTRSLTLQLAGGYNHATFSDAVPLLGNSTGGLNVTKGTKVPGVPEYNAVLGVDYAITFSGNLDGFVRGDVRAVGPSRGTFVLGAPDYYRPAYVTSDASAGLAFGAIEVSLFAKNLNDSRTVLQRPAINSLPEAYTMRPRTVGLAFNYNFGNRN